MTHPPYRYTFVEGDQPTIQETIKGTDGSTIDLTDANVKFIMRKIGADIARINADADVVAPPTSGIVRYYFVADDLKEGEGVPGIYEYEWQITKGGKTETTEKYKVLVRAQLG